MNHSFQVRHGLEDYYYFYDESSASKRRAFAMVELRSFNHHGRKDYGRLNRFLWYERSVHIRAKRKKVMSRGVMRKFRIIGNRRPSMHNVSRKRFCGILHLIPSGLRSGKNVCGNISDGIVVQTSSECGHGILSVGDLGDDGLFVAATSQVLIKRLLLKSLLRHDHILSSGVASSAVGVEDLFSVSNIASECGLDGKSEGDGTSGGSLIEKRKTTWVRLRLPQTKA